MLRLLSALTTVTTLALVSTPGVTKEIKGAPQDLQGVFAEYTEDCDAFPSDDRRMRVEIGSGVMDTCGAKICDWEIVSHVVTRSGYTLNVRELGDKGAATPVDVTTIGKDKFNWTFSQLSRPLARCPPRAFDIQGN